MSTHAPVQGKTVLDADALGRTLSRIAHEIIEGNPDLDEAGSAAGRADSARPNSNSLRRIRGTPAILRRCESIREFGAPPARNNNRAAA